MTEPLDKDKITRRRVPLRYFVLREARAATRVGEDDDGRAFEVVAEVDSIAAAKAWIRDKATDDVLRIGTVRKELYRTTTKTTRALEVQEEK